MTMRYAITHALALAAVLAALAQVSCKDFEFEQVLKTVDWSKPSFVLKLNQKSLSKSWVEDIRSNKGQIPGAVKADIEKQMNTHMEQVFPMEITVGFIEGGEKRAGLLNISMAEIDESVKNHIKQTPAELLLPTGATVDGQPVSEMNMPDITAYDWIAYEVICKDSPDSESYRDSYPTEIRAVTSHRDDCMVFSEEFAKGALPAYNFFSGVICKPLDPMAVVQSECHKWTESDNEEERVFEGHDCIASSTNSLQEDTKRTEREGVTFALKASNVQTSMKVKEHLASMNFPSWIDTRSTMDQETTLGLPHGIILDVKSKSQYDSIIEVVDFKVLDGVASAERVALCK